MALSLPFIGLLTAIGIGLSFCHHPQPKAAAAAAAKAQAATAVAQDQADNAVHAATEAAQAKTVRILITTQEAVHDVQAAPGASSPVPPVVAAAWGAGIDRLRQQSADGGADPGADAGAAAPGLPEASAAGQPHDR